MKQHTRWRLASIFARCLGTGGENNATQRDDQTDTRSNGDPNTDQAASLGRALAMVWLLTILGMAIYESFAHVLLVGLWPVGSHAISIAIASIVATASAYVSLRQRETLRHQLAVELAEHRTAIKALANSEARYHVLFESAQESERKFRGVIEQCPEGILLVDQRRTIVEWNPALERITGRKRDEMLGRPTREIQAEFLPDDEGLAASAELRHPAYALLAGGEIPRLDQIMDRRIRRAEGTQRVVQEALFRVETGDGLLSGAVIHDVTEQREAEERLSQSEARYRAVVEDQSEMIFRFRPDGKITFVNSAYCRYFDVMPEQVLGQSFQSDAAADPHQRIWAYLESLTPEQPIALIEHPIVLLNGERRWIQWAVRAIFDAEGRVTEYQPVGTDFTDRRKAEVQKEEALAALQEERAALERRVAERTAELRAANFELARANRLKDEFLDAISHELRTPLSVIVTSAQMLEGRMASKKQEQYVQHIIRSAQNQTSLMNDLLDFVALSAGKAKLRVSSTPVADLCLASLRAFEDEARRKNISLTMNLDKDVTVLMVDERRLRRILDALLSNAIKFTPQGGATGLDVHVDPTGRSVNFVVWDTGIGMVPAQMDQAFELFVQLDGKLAREYEGTGLGLALVRKLVEMHGGTISVESKFGKGSRFTVSLPWLNAESTVSPEVTRDSGGVAQDVGAAQVGSGASHPKADGPAGDLTYRNP